MEELTISVAIADRPYRLTIKRSEEEIIRKAADEINKNIKYYSDNFSYNDRQDLLAMVTLEKTTNALINKNDSIESDRFVLST
ncbi:MAG: cell division protein ZapA, partial [Bacteroidales bacterium]|nr:cell division protein ZapA [Bacteroidales bacterium]